MRFLLIVIVFFYACGTFAQNNIISLSVVLNDEDLGKRMAGGTLEILQDGKPFKVETSDANGKFPIIQLPLQHIYTIRHKAENFVTKMAVINAHAKYPEDLAPVLYLDMEVSLFRSIVGIDFSFLETTPMAKFEITQNGYVEYDPVYTKNMLAKIEKLKHEGIILKRYPKEISRPKQPTGLHQNVSNTQKTEKIDTNERGTQPSPKMTKSKRRKNN